MKKDLRKDILRLRDEGLSYTGISKNLNCSKGTVSYYCGSGQKDKSRARNLLRKDKHLAKDRSNRLLSQNLCWRYKRLCGCKTCGEKDPVVLEFDHRPGVNKLSSIAAMVTDRYSIKMIKKEIRKCDVLCANCHRRKTSLERNYFRI